MILGLYCNIVDTSYTFLYVTHDDVLMAQICMLPSKYEGIKSHNDYMKLFINNVQKTGFFEQSLNIFFINPGTVLFLVISRKLRNFYYKIFGKTIWSGVSDPGL